MKTFIDFVVEAYGKGYRSPLSRIEKALGKKLSSSDEFHKKMKELNDKYDEITSKDKEQ